MKDVMVDLETLGQTPGAKILSIGAVVFDTDGLSHEFYCEVRRDSQGGLLEDPDTLEWWLKQNAAARDRLFEDRDDKLDLDVALINFGNWMGDVAGLDAKGVPQTYVWGNGGDFDNAFLQVAYKQLDIPTPWHFWNNRCYRTLKGQWREILLKRQGVYHNALDDAKSQAEHAVAILNHIQRLRAAS